MSQNMFDDLDGDEKVKEDNNNETWMEFGSCFSQKLQTVTASNNVLQDITNHMEANNSEIPSSASRKYLCDRCGHFHSSSNWSKHTCVKNAPKTKVVYKLPKKACKICGIKVTETNMSRHVKTHTNNKKRRRKYARN